MLWITWTQLLISLAITCLLAFCHLIIPWLKILQRRGGGYFLSFCGGVAVAYVFLHMLPELVEQNDPIGKVLSQHQLLLPLVDLAIFIAALLGFLLYYGLEILAEKNRQLLIIGKANSVYSLHLLMFALYNFLITYTMTLRLETGLFFTLVFTFAMLLHFFVIDKKLNRLYPSLFSHFGRFILIFALFLGWLFSVIFEPVNVFVVALMTAFLAGSVLLNVFREELPSASHTNYFGFVSGLILISLVLLAQAFLVS